MIGASVGAGGVNNAADVREIQALLNARAGAGLSVDGACGPATIAAIRAFQAGLPDLPAADGLISPPGPTYAALRGADVGPGPGAPEGAASVPAYPPPICLVLDLSDNNTDTPPLDFTALAASGAAAIILKASQADTHQDPFFAARLARVRAAGLLAGAYHFGTAAPVADQIANFTAAVTRGGGDFGAVLAVLDVERNPASTPQAPNTMSLAQADAFIAGLRAQTGSAPMVYGGADYLGGAARAGLRNLTSAPLWLAAYPGDDASRPAPLPGWSDWVLWQFTDGQKGVYGGKFAGLRCDRSLFRGDATALAAFWARQCAGAAATV